MLVSRPLSKDAFTVEETFEGEVRPSWNVAPMQGIPFVSDQVREGEIVRRLDMARWGLVPVWSKDPKAGATDVRQSFLISLLGRKTPPKGWALFTATTLASYSNSVAYAGAQKQDLAAKLAGVTEPDYRSYKQLVDKPSTNPDKAVLAMMLAAHEADLSRDSWRHPGPQAAYYLFQLQDWGYTLSEVETLITDHAMKKNTPTTTKEPVAVPEPVPEPVQEEAEPVESFEEIHAEEEDMMAEEAAAAL